MMMAIKVHGGVAMSDTRYLGTVWERFQMADGHIELTKLHMYWVKGERRFALTEAAAREAVAAAKKGGV